MLIRTLSVLAQDPSFRKPSGGLLTTKLEIPIEHLASGPTGARVRVLDFDTSTNKLHASRDEALDLDHYDDCDGVDLLVADVRFHQQNVYAIVTATLATFERALGRRVSWALPEGRHQLLVLPHAFPEANAYYSPRQGALMFGYFRDHDERHAPVFTCLSHDVVTHETAHALLHGLRPQFLLPSSSDQAAFHEGFADIVALFSVFRQREIVRHLLREEFSASEIAVEDVSASRLRSSVLLRLGEQMGAALQGGRAEALRASAELDIPHDWAERDEWKEAHRRGEILVHAMLGAFLALWHERVRVKCGDFVHLERLIDEGARTAGHLLNVAIRALDYTPPTDLLFCDYLSALVTVDRELHPDDKYGYRPALLDSFASLGIEPSSSAEGQRGVWSAPARADELVYDATHYAEMRWNRDEAFRFLWANAAPLGFRRDAKTCVHSVQPVTRISVDGVVLEETVVTYVQELAVRVRDVASITRSASDEDLDQIAVMPEELVVTLRGGAALVFDDYGRPKYSIGNAIDSPRQFARLRYLWERGHFDPDRPGGEDIAQLHRFRVTAAGGGR